MVGCHRTTAIVPLLLPSASLLSLWLSNHNAPHITIPNQDRRRGRPNILPNSDTALLCPLPLNIRRSFRVSTLGAVIACCGRSSREGSAQRRTYPYDGWGRPAKEER